LALSNLLGLIAAGFVLNPQIQLSDPPDILSRAGLQAGIIESLWIADIVIFLICLLIRISRLSKEEA
jgi:hypothetical protein